MRSKNLDDLTILIKSFIRPNKVRKLIESIRKYYPTVKIIVVDDSCEDLTGDLSDYNFNLDDNIETYNIEFDSGISKGRNYGVSKVKTPFFLLCDDDMIFNEKTDLLKMCEIVSNSDLDVLGGDLYEHTGHKRSYNGLLDVKDDVLHYSSGNRGVYPDYLVCDIVLNFFMAKTESVKKNGWDNDLKVAEHTAFFYDNKSYLKVGYNTENISISHQVPGGNPMEYAKYRGRGMYFFEIWKKKRGIKGVDKKW